MLIAALLACQALAAKAQLPPSPAARAWASVDARTPAQPLAADLLAGDPWLLAPLEADPALRWSRWADWLAAERAAPQAQARRRAGLLLLATSDGRWEDAWAHFARLGAWPEWAAAFLPHLFLGLPIDHPLEAGGQPAPMAQGVLLRPALPPAPAGAPANSLVQRAASFPGLRIGAAVVDLRITLEPSGVQVDLLHVRGPATRVRVLMPEPEGYSIRVEYIDWMREDERRAPLEVELLPGSEEHNLFARFANDLTGLPSLPAGSLASSLKRGGLWLEVEQHSDTARELAGFAAALGQLFDLHTGLCTPARPPPLSPWTRTVCHMGGGRTPRSRLVELASMAERYALGANR